MDNLSQVNRPLNLESHSFRALGLFHGRKSRNMWSFIEEIADQESWYFLDQNPDCDPDLICDVSDRQQISCLPNQYFDVIASLYFPIGLKDNVHRYTDILLSIRRCLKPDGCIFLFEMPKCIHYFINIQQRNIIIDLYISTLDLETRKKIASTMNSFNSCNPLYLDSTVESTVDSIREIDILYATMNFADIYHLAYNVPTIINFYRARNTVYTEFATKYLSNLGYEVIICTQKGVQIKLKPN